MRCPAEQTSIAYSNLIVLRNCERSMLVCPEHAVLLSALLYAGIFDVRMESVIRYIHPGYIWVRGTYLMYPLGRVPTHPFRVLGFVVHGKKRGELCIWRY